MNNEIIITSENGKHELAMSEECYADILETWGIDMKKFVSKYLTIRQNFDESGKWTVKMTHCLNSDETECETQENSIGFVFNKIFNPFEN